MECVDGSALSGPYRGRDEGRAALGRTRRAAGNVARARARVKGRVVRMGMLLVSAWAGGVGGLSEARAAAAPAPTLTVIGEVIDDGTSRPVPARLYVWDKNGRWYFPRSASAKGTAIRYERRNGANTNAVEMHTTLSADPFVLELPSGSYTFQVERGKECRPFVRRIEIELKDGMTNEPVHLKFPLRRWIRMDEEGWFSGDTHAHRDLAELPNVMLAEDVNVVWPMTYWTTVDSVPPSKSPRNMKGAPGDKLVKVDANHVYYPRNTEYEIFETGGRRHTLGALMVLNHKTVLDLPALPVGAIAARARGEGALLDLEKHNWDWSAALAPIVKPDLFELANNHHWRTEFAVTNWAVPAPEWMGVGTGSDDERGWTLYGFQTYYALLNCGFRIKPAAGTANGVHPVPLGFGRVYVRLEGGFNYQAWVRGLAAGHSFVTTGPMLFSKVNNDWPGRVVRLNPGERRQLVVEGQAVGDLPVSLIEILVNGEVVQKVRPRLNRSPERAWESPFRETIEVSRSGWVAVRCWEGRDDGRVRFAHTAPTWIEVKGESVRPRRREVEWLAARARAELARSREVLPAAAIAEYEQAVKFYENKLTTAE